MEGGGVIGGATMAEVQTRGRRMPYSIGVCLRLALIVTGLTACTPAGSTGSSRPTVIASAGVAASQATGDAAWRQVVEAGTREGRVVIYGSFEQSLQDAYIPEFKKRYPGIEVDVVFAPGPQAAEKIRAEVAAGKVVADLWRSFTDPALAMRDQGLLEQWQAPSLVRERSQYAYQASDEDRQGYLNNVAATVTGIMINTRQLPAEDEPASWFDLASPKYRSKMIVNDPRVPSGGQSLAWFISEHYGQSGAEFLRKLGEQDMQYEASAPRMAEEVARGERPIAWPVQWASYRANQGPDVKFLQPTEGLYYSIANAVIVKDAPHPNAAKLWIEWEVSSEGQQVKVNAGQETAIRKDVTARETWLRLDTAGAWASISFDDRQSKQDAMRTTVKSFFPN
ncbi:MAG: ABC transporter substrate-binding protein [Chloroflexota bacterium]